VNAPLPFKKHFKAPRPKSNAASAHEASPAEHPLKRKAGVMEADDDEEEISSDPIRLRIYKYTFIYYFIRNLLNITNSNPTSEV
jgi:hypothetical protein